MRKERSAVIDTNVIISAIIGKSKTLNNIYNAFVDGLFTPVLSPALQEEIFNVVKKPRIRKYFRANEIKRFQELLKTDTLLVIPTKKVAACRDGRDNFLLEIAVEANADCIVTGDDDLLVMKSFAGIPIVTPAQFLKILHHR